MSLVKVVWVEGRHPMNASVRCGGSSFLIQEQSPYGRVVFDQALVGFCVVLDTSDLLLSRESLPEGDLCMKW